MKSQFHTLSLGAAILSLCLAPLGCGKKGDETMPPGAERGGAGADGNNSAPESISNGGPDPDTTPLTEPSTAAGESAGTDDTSPPK